MRCRYTVGKNTHNGRVLGRAVQRSDAARGEYLIVPLHQILVLWNVINTGTAKLSAQSPRPLPRAEGLHHKKFPS